MSGSESESVTGAGAAVDETAAGEAACTTIGVGDCAFATKIDVAAKIEMEKSCRLILCISGSGWKRFARRAGFRPGPPVSRRSWFGSPRFAIAAPEGFWVYQLTFPGQSSILMNVELFGDIAPATVEKLRPFIGFDTLRARPPA